MLAQSGWRGVEVASGRKTALAFMACWGESFAALRGSFSDYFCVGTVWENVGFSTSTGAEQAQHFVDRYRSQTGLATIEVEIVRILSSGSLVMTERIDRLRRDNGSIIHSARVMGVFEIGKGRITAQRDYVVGTHR